MEGAATRLGQLLGLIDIALSAAQQPPLTVDERAMLRDDLSRVPELVDENYRFRGHNQTFQERLPVGVAMPIANWIQRWRQDRDAPLVDQYGNPRTSLASLYYYDAIQNLLGGYQAADRFDPLYVYVTQRSVWDSDDLAEQRRMYERSKDVLPPATGPAAVEGGPAYTNIQRFALLRIGDILYDPTDPRYSGLGRELDRLGLDWRGVVLATPVPAGSATSARESGLIEAALVRLRGAIERVEKARTSPTRATRGQADQADYTAGRLKPNCIKWTYEELEAWSLWALRDLSAPDRREAVCGWLARYRDSYKVEVAGQPFTECGALPSPQVAEVAREVVRLVPKAALCDLLVTVKGGPPEVYGRLSFAWFNLNLLSPYLPAAALTPLLAELEGRGDQRWTMRYAPEGRQGETPPPRVQAVVDDLVRQLRTTSAGVVQVEAEVRELLHFSQFDLQQQNALALVDLAGQALVQLVTTAQRRRLGGTDVRENLPSTQLAEPTTSLLEPGDALTVKLSSIDRATVEPLYDYVVVRPIAKGTRMLIVRVTL